MGILGISYDGFTSLMALVNPHPALRAAVPINAMVDGWRGDDWFHNGAFRLDSLTYFHGQEASRASDVPWWSDHYDDYDTWLSVGAAGDMARLHGLEQVGFTDKVMNHPAYDAFWQDQALDKILAQQGVTVPVMLAAHSLWDQEDIYGNIALYAGAESTASRQSQSLPGHRSLVPSPAAARRQRNRTNQIRQRYGALLSLECAAAVSRSLPPR